MLIMMNINETERLVIVYRRGRSCRTLNITKHILWENPVWMDFVYVCVYNKYYIHTLQYNYKTVGIYYKYHGVGCINDNDKAVNYCTKKLIFQGNQCHLG